MKQDLIKLTKLQRTDDALADVENRVEELKQNMLLLRQACDGLSEELDRQRQELNEIETMRKDQESELKQSEEKVGKGKGRLAGVKNVKEYMAIQRELELARKDVSKREEETVKLMDAEKGAHAQIDDRQGKLDKLKEEVSAREQEALRRIEESADALSALQKKHQLLAQSIPKQLLKKYQMIRNRRDGVAVVMVSGGTCQGCHIGIPAQLYNELHRGDRIEQCPSCHRIIYWEGLLEGLEEGNPEGPERDAE